MFTVSWIDIKTENDVKRMLERVEHFHDWFVAGYSHDALGNCDNNDLNLGRLKEGLNALITTFRWDCKCKANGPKFSSDLVTLARLILAWGGSRRDARFMKLVSKRRLMDGF